MPEPTDAPDLREPLDRRAFLSHAAVLGAAATGGLGWSPAARGPGPPRRRRRRRGVRLPPWPPFELEEITIAELQAGMASGRYTAKRVVELYLERIAAMDRKDVALQAIIETNPEALALAEALDRERAAKGPRGPLHGIPVLLKDNIDTADRMTTTAGSLALEGSIPAQDAHLAERLRAAGAILLAKANMSEWANIRSNRSSSGWSARGGQCRNPFVLDRNPCGSSSGSAAAVSANFGAVAVGTETDGSIVCPASACGVVGLKPTVGLVSRAGVIPISHTQDTAGPLCRTVADAAALLGALAGADPRDRATTASVRPRRAGLHQVPRPGRPPRRADRRGPREVLRLQRRDRPPGGGRHRRVPARRRHRGRPGGHPARRAATTTPSSRCCCSSSRPISTPISPSSAPPRRCARWPT